MNKRPFTLALLIFHFSAVISPKRRPAHAVHYSLRKAQSAQRADAISERAPVQSCVFPLKLSEKRRPGRETQRSRATEELRSAADPTPPAVRLSAAPLFISLVVAPAVGRCLRLQTLARIYTLDNNHSAHYTHTVRKKLDLKQELETKLK